MTKPDFISDSAIFYPLWERANGRVQELASASPGELLYFDSMPLSNLEWVDCRVKCGRKPGVANT